MSRAVRVWYIGAVLGAAAACGEQNPRALPEVPDALMDANAAQADAATRDAALDSSAADAADAGVDEASAALTVHRRVGSSSDDTAAPAGPGLLLDSGSAAPAMLNWMHRACSSAAAGRCDVVVLSATSAEFSAPWLAAAPFNSAQTLVLAPAATAADFRIAAAIVARAEVVYFMGGDQARYVRWAGTPLLRAVQGVYDRGGVVGGGSAGMIILGSSVNDALNTLSENLTTPLCLADPYDPKLHFSQNLFRFAPLARVITDPHFSARDRMGRLATFMARQIQDGAAAPDILGVGIDDGAALGIDKTGDARLLQHTPNSAAYVVRGGTPTQARAGMPLLYNNLLVLKLQSATDHYDFSKRCGQGAARTLSINGAATPPYANAYAGGTLIDTCM